MRRESRCTGYVTAVMLGLPLLLAACGGASSPAPTPTSATGTFVGQVAGSTALIAYVCDGTSDHITIAQWFNGPVTSNAVSVTTNNGAHLTATLTSKTATGTVTLSGRTFTFTATALAGQSEAGLYRSEQIFNGVHYLGGWIVLSGAALLPAQVGVTDLSFAGQWMAPPSTLRGGIRNEQTGTLLTSPRPDFANERVVVPNLGTFMLHPAAAVC
ncbi:MAG: hypothetical protein NVSMB27_07050 [Ktedonobacteraceae bacterium]